MRKAILVCVLLVLLCSLSIVSVDAASTWSRTFGGARSDQANSVIAASDGGYVIAGCAYYYIPSESDFWLVKTDEFGNVEWDRTCGTQGPVFEVAKSLVATSDGGYALAGSTNTFPTGNSDFWLVKTDALGNMEWDRKYGGTEYDKVWSLVATSDGGYALAGFSLLVKTDAFGNMEWNRTYGGTEEDYAYSIVATSDGGYALAGVWDYSGVSDFWLVKTDALGNMEWNKTYGGTGENRAHSLVATSDGGYALAGTDCWLVKTDANGVMEWNKNYGEGTILSLAAAADGGYALAGGDLLVKTDALGNIQWNRTYGEGGNADFVCSLVEASDGGYVITGYTSLSGDVPFLYDSWLVKIDENGMGPTPIPTSTPTPTATASPSPTPSVPEFPSTAILPLLAGFVILSIIFSKTKRAREI